MKERRGADDKWRRTPSPLIIRDLTDLVQVQEGAEPKEESIRVPFPEDKKKKGLDNFQGLSAGQMHRFLYFPFDTPHLATFPSCIDGTCAAPIMTLFLLLCDHLGGKGVHPTVSGNLPEKLCQEVALAFLGAKEYRVMTAGGEIRSELEFFELNVTRLVAEMAGLIRKYDGKFILSRDCRKALAHQRTGTLYPRLLRAYATKFDWGYGDSWEGSPLIQQSFLFSLYLLEKYGGQWRSNHFYEDLFLRAYPGLLREVRPAGALSTEDAVRRCYATRCLAACAGLLGLAEAECVEWDYAEFRLRKTPLLHRAVQFHLSC